MKPNEKNKDRAAGRSPEKEKWETMKLTYIGNISEVIKTGGGKLSIAGGDPGEGKKQKGGGE